MIDELPAALRDAIAAERRVVPSATSRAAIHAKLGVTVAAAAKGGAIATATGIALKTIVATVLVVGGGIAAFVATRAPARVSVAHAPPPPPVAAPIIESIRAPNPSTPTPIPSPPPPVPPPSSTRPIEPEATMLARAIRALHDGDAATAHAIATRHAHIYPTGSLSEERDALDITALVQLGRTAEARVLATRFRAAHPSSIHIANFPPEVDP